MSAKLFLESVIERDMDLLLMRLFLEHPTFLYSFLRQIEIPNGYTLETCTHSLSDQNGESDITLVVKNGERRIGILIEDKINASAQPNQATRYYLRGDDAIREHTYQEFRTVLVAPMNYFETNSEKYDYEISYEYLMGLVENGSFARQLISKALQKKQTGYFPVSTPPVEDFWNHVFELLKEFPQLSCNAKPGVKGPKNGWINLTSPVKRTYIVYKCDRAYVDLELAGLGEKYQEFMRANSQVMKRYPDVRVERAHKSLAVRKMISAEVDFYEPFDQQEGVIREAFSAAIYLKNEVLPYLQLNLT